MTWQSVPFGNLFEIQLGKMLDDKKNVGEFRSYLANRNVQWGTCDLSDLGKMRFTDADRQKFALRDGDLLVCEGGEVGRTAIWTGELQDCYYQKAVHRLRPTGDIEPRFVLHYMRWAAAKDLFTRLTSATSIAHLTKAKLQKFTLPLPPLDEQRRIARILDAAAALRAKRRESLAQLDTLLQSTFLDMFGDPVTNPKRWRMGRLSDVVERLDGGKNVAQSETATDFRVLKVSSVTYGEYRPEESKYLPATFEVPESYLVCKGDLLISRANTVELIGATAYVWETPKNMVLPDKIWKFIWQKSAEIEPLFIYHVTQNAEFRRILGSRASGTSGSMKNIAKPKLLGLPIPLPPHDLQHRFAAIVESIEQQKTTQRAHLAELDTLFASLQSRAFRGNL